MKPPLGRFTVPSPAGLALTDITGNVTRTAAGTLTAWYELGGQRWAFRTDTVRDAWLDRCATQYATLPTTGAVRLHLRRTTRPWPVGAWAGTVLHASAVADPAAEEALLAHVQGAARHLDKTAPTETVTYLGVELPGPSATALLGRVSNWVRRRPPEQGDTLADQTRRISDLLAPAGLAATPAGETPLTMLLLRSVALGLTPPDRKATSLGAPALLEMTGRYVRERTTPYGRRVRYIDTVTGQEAWVAALTVGPMDEVEIPERHEPWWHLADHAGFPVEISSRVGIVSPKAAEKALQLRLAMITNQQRDYAEKDLTVPPHLERLAAHAVEAGDEVSTGRPNRATRIHGWHRIAVWGATETECEERAAVLVDLYEQRGRTVLHRTADQGQILREFIPGEPAANTGYLRRMPVKLWAAAAPQVSQDVGDRRGDLLGWIDGTRAPFVWNPHAPMEFSDKSGLAVLVAEPGGGKSTLVGAVGAQAAIRGVRTTILDPSGPLAHLADLPQLHGRARVLNLAGAQPGTLAPYSLVPTPQAGDYTDLGEWERDVRLARAERKALVVDVCQMLLPPQTLRRPQAVEALRSAVRAVPLVESSTLEHVVAALFAAGNGGDVDAKTVAGLLEDAADLPLASLLFGQPAADAVPLDAPLVVITLGGLRLPDLKTDREYWSIEEALAVPMLHCAHLLAARRCYAGSRHVRKLVGLDEAHFMQEWPSGRAFLVRLARDSRKWNLAALLASQNPRDILGLEVQNLVSTVFVGRVADDDEIAAEALRLLRVADTPDGRYRRQLAGLSQQADGQRLGFREFVVRDVAGRVQQVRIDLSWAPDLLRVLDTTPDGSGR